MNLKAEKESKELSKVDFLQINKSVIHIMEAVVNKYLTVLETDVSGFIRRKLIYSLAEMGYHVLALCRRKNRPYLIPH